MRKVNWSQRKKILKRMLGLRAQGLKSADIAKTMNEEGSRTKKGLEWTGQKIDAYVYTCKQSGMRKLQARGPKQMSLSEQANELKKSYNYDNVAKEIVDNTHKTNLVMSIVASNLPTHNKTQAIIAILGE